ncbi:MAG: metal-dependent hydrolase [Caulobacteraceae bacterium]|nr:metal-dependent hydrolase [Caulobacteraceae bacterium]
MSGRLRFTILGCGYSGGVPRADGAWGACDPDEPKNRRSRCSLLAQRLTADVAAATTLVIDTSPDLRFQFIAAGVRRLDAALLTHDHADQTHGIDDLRAFFLNQGHRIPVWMEPVTFAGMQEKFWYIFNDKAGYPAICDARSMPPFGQTFEVTGPSGPLSITPFDLDHGFVRSVGYRIGDLAYAPDVVAIPEASFEILTGVRVLIVDALRWSEHPSHANVAQALAWIERLKPQRAILTNMHSDLDYNVLKAKLPDNVEPAFDGLVVELNGDEVRIGC